MKYRREIDGLRALAVLPVMLFHAGFTAFSGGFVGVDVFFVISGYLITYNILSEKESGTFSLVNFYERRARRILPALFFVMAMCIPFAWLLLLPNDLQNFSKSLVAVSLFVSNILFWREGGYFEDAVELKPLIHTWSLAVEEQYYLLFPLFVLFLWRFGRRWIIGMLAVVALASLAVSQWGAYNKPVMTFYLLPTRGWELAIGAFIALYFAKKKRDLNVFFCQIMSGLGLFLVIYAVFAFSKNTPFPSLYTLIPTIGAALIILCAKPSTMAGKVLGSNAFVGIGLISYSAYLWHQPLFSFVRYMNFGEPGMLLKSCLILLTLIFAFLTWKYVEQPFRNKTRFPRSIVFGFSLFGSLFFITIGLFSLYLFGGASGFSTESKLAYTLSRHNAVIAGNMDERLFVKSRINIEDLNPNVIIVGSSRIMQIGKHNLRDNCLNLSVSGASIQDDIAIVSLATRKFHPKKIIIGVDPWLFNAKSGQDRWRSLNKEYLNAVSEFNSSAIIPYDQGSKVFSSNKDKMFGSVLDFYEKISLAETYFEDDSPTRYKDIIRKDGSRVYSTIYSNKSQEEIERGFNDLLSYSMESYSFSPKSFSLFERFLDYYYNQKYEIILVLSPYHPQLYKRIKKERRVFLDVENQFRDLAKRKNIKIIGSYDPDKVGCSASFFYDGMHPKDVCMELVLKELDLQPVIVK